MRRTVEIDEAGIIASIRMAVEVGDFEYDRAHCDYHMGREGFTLDEAVLTVVTGEVIESSPERNRWLFCNRVRTLRADPLYRGHWLHVSVEHDEPGVFIVTTYRPLVSEWRTERARR
jgi:hypothetical protein